MDRRVLIPLAALALAAPQAACIDWDSLYAPTGGDADGGDSSTTPDAHQDPMGDDGCSDGEVEVSEDETAEGTDGGIVACAGAWSVPGVISSEETTCGRAAGDDGQNLSGEGCSVADLCAVGWHVCRTADEVAAHQGAALCEHVQQEDAAIYITRQGSTEPDNERCSSEAQPGSGDDVYGCGTLGLESADCEPLDRRLAIGMEGDAEGSCPPPFNCGEDSASEGINITKTGPSGGGVLCCRD